MAFTIHITDDDQEFLDGLRLSPRARKSLEDFIHKDLANIKDEVRADPSRRLAPGNLFIWDIFLVDYWGDERSHRVLFTVDDSRAEMGVLAIVYVDHEDAEWRPL